MRRIVLIAGLCAVNLQGCSTIPTVAPEPVTAGTDVSTTVEGLLAYYRRFTQATTEIQRKDHAEALTAYERAPEDVDARIRLAMTLMNVGVPWRDDVRAQQLLAGVGPEVATGKADLIYVLDRILSARRDDQKKCEQRLETVREEKRKAEQRIDGLRDECKKADQLQQKLDELRDIDRELRNNKPTRRTRP